LAIANQMLVDGIDPAFPGPLIGPYTEARLAMRNGLEAMSVGGLSPQQALDEMQTELDTAFERYQDEGF
jgi:sn-glycerol 3-phosphate transport system substrate-binding protein